MRRPPFDPPEAKQIHLRLLATTDVHVQIRPYDYYADRPVPGPGLSRVAALIAAHRAEAPNCLLFDNGDILQGSPMGDHAAEVLGLSGNGIHPAIAAMNALRYDAATPGNHEFNYGLDFLRHALEGARFPFTCDVLTRAADDPAQDETLLPPFLILPRACLDAAGHRQELRIGVIGVLPPQIMIWDSAHLRDRVFVRDILTAAKARLPQMRAAGADLVVALCHSGIGPAEAFEGMENAATALAALPGIDAVIAGHSHLVFPGQAWAGLPGVDPVAGTLSGTPAVMPGCFGSHLGVIDLVLEQHGPRWHVVRSRSEAQPISTRPSAANDPGTQALLDATRADHQATLAHVRRAVGHSDIPLTTFFGALPGNAALDLIARAQVWHVTRALADTAHAALPLLSAASPFKMGGRGGPGFFTDVPAGPLAVRHVADLYPYPNTICAVLVTGAEVMDWLERAAGVFRTIAPGQPDQPLLDPNEPSSHFDVIAGMTWEIDLSRPAKFASRDRMSTRPRGRIRNLRHNGKTVAPGDRFVMATNSYRAGGASFPGTGGDAMIYWGTEPIRDILARFLQETGPVCGPSTSTWRFIPLPGTTVFYDSSPRATAHLETVAPLRIEPAGPAPGGFARFRIRL